MKPKRCTEVQIPHSNRMITHRASESVYCTTTCH